MIELKNDELVFSFPEVHPAARLRIDFQRTLRIPDDDKDYPLPPGLGSFPLRHVDDFAEKVPQQWFEHGGVMLPMYQSEAMWLYFRSTTDEERWAEYPFAIKVATGKICAVTGEEWRDGLDRRPQNYMVAPEQPWLDGYCVEKGIIRQFVAMPLGAGYSTEEQLTGKAEHGGLQIAVYPMKRRVFELRFRKTGRLQASVDACSFFEPMPCAAPDMGLAPGGRMKQEIYDDPFSINDWDLENTSRCFIHICNSLVWRQITGANPPTVPPTSKEYTDHGLPWFEYYADNATAVSGSEKLKGVKSASTMASEKGDIPLPENESVDPKNIINIRKGLAKNQVREGAF